MHRLLLLVLFIVLPVDLAVVDAPLVAQAGGRAAAWDDEEEGIPSRRPRPTGDEGRTDASPPGPRSVEPDRAARRGERAARAGLNRAVAWLVPLRQAHLPAASAASPPEDH